VTEQARFEWDEHQGKVALTGGPVHAEWRMAPDGRLVCVRLHDPVHGTGWTDQTPMASATLDAVTTTQEGGVTRLSCESAWEGTTLRVRWTVEAYDGHPTVRQWATITNTGTANETVARLPVLTVLLGAVDQPLRAHCGLDRRPYTGPTRTADWYTWRTVDLRPGVVDAIRTGHRKEATWLGLTTPGGGPGLYAGWETNAETTAEFGDITGEGRTGLNCWLAPDYRLAPGASLTAPAGFVGLANGDLDELCYRCHRFADDVLAPPVDDARFPYVEFNSWGYGDDIDAAGMRQCLDVCERLGVELFVVDFGWEDPDWQPLADRFPDGLAPLAALAHGRGMLFGIHLSFGNVSSLSKMYAEHPEWANGPGQWAYRKEGDVFGLTLGNPDTRAWIVDRIVDVIDANHVDYFLTDHFLWGPANPHVQDLHATNDYVTVVEGYEWIIDRIRQLRPGVVIEHCDDGLALPTFQMVSQHMTSIGTDAPGAMYERIGTYRISHVLPPRYLDHYAPDQPMGDWEFRSHLFGGPLILMTPIHALATDSAEFEVLARNIALYKEIRHRVVRGKVLHLLEPQVSDRVGDGWDGWDAIGSYDAETDSAVVFAFRLGDVATRRNVPLHGLAPDTTYDVRLVDRKHSFQRTGRELTRDGLDLDLADRTQPGDPNARRPAMRLPRSSEVVLLTPATAT
jgi:alpha-galactosidase